MFQNRRIRLDDINFFSVFIDIMRNLWVVIIVSAAAWMAVGTYSTLAFVAEYTSTATFCVSTRGTASTVSNLNVTRGLAEVFSTVFESDVLKSQVGEQMGTTHPDYQITAQVIPETNLLRVTVVAKTPQEAFRALTYTIDNYENISEYMFDNAILNVLKAPNVPMSPSNSLNAGSAQKKAAVAAGLLMILIIGVLSATRETVQTRQGARHNLEGELYGHISHDEKQAGKKQVMDEDEKEALDSAKRFSHGKKRKSAALVTNPLVSYHFREDCQKLCARIDYSMRHHREKVLMVSSAAENEGKSTVAANLALCLASRGRNVLLIDCDFRKPALHKIFQIEKGTVKDFAEYILDETGTLSTSDVVVRSMDVDLAINHAYYDVPQRLITSDRMKKILAACKNTYDYIIIDSPPMLVASDAEALAGITDTSMLVVRQDWTHIRDINDCIDLLQKSNARFVGYVLNNFQNGGRKSKRLVSNSNE